MSKKVQLVVMAVIVVCIGGVAVSFLKSETGDSGVEQSAVSTSPSNVATTSTDSGTVVPAVNQQEEVVPEPVTHTKQASAPDSPKVTEAEAPPEPEEEVESEIAGERKATNVERAKMKAAVEDFLEILHTGTRDEVKYAMGYNEVTAEEKAEFDDFTKTEYEMLVDFMGSIMEDVPYALDHPDEYTTTIAANPNGKYDVVIMDGENEENSSEYYKLYFKPVGSKWVMVNPGQ